MNGCDRRDFLNTSATFAALSAVGLPAAAEGAPALELFASSADHPWNGVAVAPDGRLPVAADRPACLGALSQRGRVPDRVA